jgi:magnesium chelatase subunit I
LLDDLSEKEYKERLDSIPPLNQLIDKYQSDISKEDSYFLKEFLLWGLVEYKKLNKYRFTKGIQFKDLYGSYISGL